MSDSAASRSGLAVLLLLSMAAAATPASAQYFGRQKVQYDDFDWQVLKTPKFSIHYYPESLRVTQDAARMAERWYVRLSGIFQHEFEDKPLILYADHPDFQQTNVVSGELGESTGGVTEGLRNRVIMPYTGVYADNDHVLGHELVHVFQYDLAASPVGGGLAGFTRLPLWLVEGMAEYLSLGRVDAHTAMWLRDAALRGELPTIRQLTTDQRFFPYRYGQALWAFIAGRWGDRAVTEVFRIATHSGFEEALVRVIGMGSEPLSQEWITSIRATYLPLIEGRQRPQDVGRPVLVEEGPGAMNLSPAVSPDGRTVAFFGRRDLFTVDLLLADAATGKIIKRLHSPQRDQHIDAISFVAASGGWSADGRKFAFVVFQGGDNVIAILDVPSTDVERRIEVPGVGAVSDPKFSPDGRQLVFSGMKGGQSDLYLLDLAGGDVEQLTDDRYADVQPAWSPDGTTIAFVTDRGPDTDFDRLTYGAMNLALYDVATRAVRPLSPFPGVKHIDPQFSPDGRSLYFISGRDGFSDVYRIEPATGQVFQVTRLATGVSGITGLSPAIGIARGSGLLMFSAFENSGNNIYAIDCSTPCGTPVETGPASKVAAAALLPPSEALGGGVVYGYLSDPSTGLPPADVAYPSSDYRARIGLEYLGPPSFGVGVGGYYGTELAGSVSAYFGDMLGDHFVGAAIQANGTLKDIGGQAIYMNAARRLNWGASVGHIPYLTGYAFFQPRTDGFYDYTQLLQRIFIDQASAITYYPLSTARRIELSAGITRYSFNTEIQRAVFNAFGQQVSPIEIIDTTSIDPINFFASSLAYVGDNTEFGFTSPVTGRRFRIEAAPTFGSLNYQTALADFRQYSFKNPFTFAFRLMHYGRYGRDSDGMTGEGLQVLSPLFLGYESLVRGYSQESFDGSECRADPDNPLSTACPAWDRLLGSRIVVANFEFRIPLIGVPEFGIFDFPFLPTEIAPFIDMGVAWTANDEPVLEFKRDSFDRTPVFSAGISARFNLLGFAVLEGYYAYPFQRPDKGWHLGFNLMPGW
jgi:hypothetical protein